MIIHNNFGKGDAYIIIEDDDRFHGVETVITLSRSISAYVKGSKIMIQGDLSFLEESNPNISHDVDKTLQAAVRGPHYHLVVEEQL